MDVQVKNDVETVLKALKKNDFNPVEFVETGEAAAKLILDWIPVEASVGVAGSTTIRQLGLVEKLKARGTKVIDIFAPSETPTNIVRRQSLNTDVMLSSTNAVTLDGRLVNLDGRGNRVAGMAFGPKKNIMVIGANKICRDFDEAYDRVRNFIAPFHTMTYQRAMLDKPMTPCGINGQCNDCKSPYRICCITSIIEFKPFSMDFAIVLVGEDLGLGFDPAWPEARKEKSARFTGRPG